jgi:hypothetical protein
MARRISGKASAGARYPRLQFTERGMKYAIIKCPSTYEMVEAETFDAAKALAGLKPLQTDIGAIIMGVSIVVYEFGLYLPAKDQSYFTIGRELYVNSGLLYHWDAEGETRPFTDRLFRICTPTFMTYDEVEEAIKKGTMNRPTMKLNNEIIWQWPNPKPKGMFRDDRL